MFKKIIQYSLIAIAIGCIGYVLYTFYKGEEKYTDSLSAIPSGAAMVLDVHSFSRVGKYEEWLNSLTNSNDFNANPAQGWPELIGKLDSVRSVNELWQTLLLKSNVIFAHNGQLLGKSWWMSIGLREGQDDVESLAGSLIGGNLTSRTFKNSKVFESGGYQIARVNNCFVLAPSASLIEEAIIKGEKKENLTADAGFDDVLNLSGKDIPFNFYFTIGNGEWMQLDPLFENGLMLLSGYAIMSETSQNALKITSSTTEFTAAKYLPSNTEVLEAFSFEDFDTAWKTQEKLYSGSTIEKFWGQAWQDFGDSCACDLNEIMLSWRGGEWGNAIVPTSDSTTAAIRYITVRDTLNVPEIMQSILSSDTQTPGVFAIKFPQLFERNQPQSFLVETNYLMQKGNIVLIGRKPKDLLYLNNIVSSLAENENYNKALNNLSPAGGRLIYQKEYYVSPLPQMVSSLLSGNEYFAAGISSFKDNKYLVTIALPSETVRQETTEVATGNTQLLWNYSHAAGIRNSWSVINHNTGLPEVLIQDENNILHLIGTDGKPLWKKELGSPVIGDVKQIDALKNGKLQLAFTTKDALHILDRNGNNLTGFPVKPSGTIESELFLFDYDKQKNYRLMFATADGMIQNYTSKGTPAEGWKYKANEKPQFISHFKTGNEDQLLVVYSSGKTGLFKRTGEERQKIALVAGNFSRGYSVTSGSTIDDCSLVYSDKENNVNSGSLVSGTIRKINTAAGNTFCGKGGDINLDGEDDFVFANGSQLRMVDDSGNLLKEKSISGSIQQVIPVGKSLTEPLIATATSDSIFVFRQDATIVSGFPVEGQKILSFSDINGDKKSDCILINRGTIRAITP